MLVILAIKIKKLKYDELIMKSCKVCSFIGLYILHTNIMHWKHVWHMGKCVDVWITDL
jgi:hypothetical protein